MAGMVVDTDALRTSAGQLRAVSRAAADVGGESGLLMSYVPAVGQPLPAQALSSFAGNWVFGVGWIGVQAHEISDHLLSAAYAVDEVEATLCREIRNPRPAAASPGPVPQRSAAPEPARPATPPMWGLLPLEGRVPPQLSSVRHAGELVPGDPDQVLRAAGLLVAYADTTMDALVRLGRSDLGGWDCETAMVVRAELDALADRLRAAANAFDRAATALKAYAGVHADALRQAEQALRMFREAEHDSEVLRGAVVGELPRAGVTEETAAAAMTLANRMVAGAREELVVAGKKLAAALRAAEAGAPDDPGLMAGVMRNLQSYATGFAEQTVGIVKGPLDAAALGWRLLPHQLADDPGRWWNTVQAIWGAVWGALTHPIDTLEAGADTKTLHQDPAKWLGKITPELALGGISVYLAGASKAGAAVERLEQVGARVKHAVDNGRPVGPPTDPDDVDDMLAQLGINATSPAGAAVRAQMRPPYGGSDQWLNTNLRQGSLIVVDPRDLESGFAAPFNPGIGSDAKRFYESIQSEPRRDLDNPTANPAYPDHLLVFELRGTDIEAAQATALANVRLGEGGGSKLFIENLGDLIDADHLKQVDTHRFDPNSVVSQVEDPRYRFFDDALPQRALDPERAADEAERAKLREELSRAAGGAAASGMYSRLETQQQQTASQPVEPVPEGSP